MKLRGVVDFFDISICVYSCAGIVAGIKKNIIFEYYLT
jgi:hypothetical protein